MKKTTVKKPKKQSFASAKRRKWLQAHKTVVSIVLAAVFIVALLAIIIGVVVKSAAEKTRNQLASANPTPTTEATTETTIDLAGVSDAQEPSTEEEPTTEVEEEPTEEVTEATEEATEEEATEEEATEEAQPSEGAQPTEAQPTQQQTQQPTQQQPTQQPTEQSQPTQTQPTEQAQQPTTGGTSWSWSYHNDNGVVTVSVTGDFPSDLDPNNPEAVHQWVMNHYGFDPMWFF
jgi:cell division protein FtsN